jgi:hypothetical protein
MLTGGIPFQFFRSLFWTTHNQRYKFILTNQLYFVSYTKQKNGRFYSCCQSDFAPAPDAGTVNTFAEITARY